MSGDHKLALAVLILAALTCGSFLVRGSWVNRGSHGELSGQAPAKQVVPDALALEVHGPTHERTPASAPQLPPRAGSTAADPPSRFARGLVLDVAGRPMPGIAVSFRSLDPDDPYDHQETHADGAGRFELRVGPVEGVLVCAKPRFATLYMVRTRQPEGPEPPLIVVGPARLLEGCVVDPQGDPVDGTEVLVDADLYLGWTLDVSFEWSTRRSWRSVTNAEGQFRIEDAPASGSADVTVRREGFHETTMDVPAGLEPLRIQLRPRSRVHGRVLDPRGAAVWGATVLHGKRRERCSRSGEFRIDLEREASTGTPLEVVAFGPGWLPVRASPGEEELLIRLRDPAPRILGRVLDADGTPVPGARVSVLDPVDVDELLRFAGLDVVGKEDRGDRTLGSTEVGTREDGRFEIPGLLPRSFRLRAHDPRTLAKGDEQVVKAGSGVELRFGSEPAVAIRGKSVDPRGVPLEGVHVSLRRGPEGDAEMCTDGVVTGSDGGFSFRAVRSADLAILVEAYATVHPKEFSIPHDSNPDALTLVVGRLARLQVAIATPGLKADVLQVLEAAGGPLWVERRSGGGGTRSQEWDLDDEGRSGPVWVSEEATTLVLFLEGVEVGRVPLRLSPGGITSVRP